MSRSLLTAIAATLLVGMSPGPVWAQEPKEAGREPVWSVGAGVGLGSVFRYGFGGGLGCLGTSDPDPELGGYGCVGWPAPSPSGQVVVERRLGESFALMLELSLEHSERDANLQSYTWETEETSVGALTGIRWIFNPGGVVEVSSYVALDGAWHWLKSTSLSRLPGGESSWGQAQYHGYTVGLSIGFVLERELLDNLYIRLGSSLVYLSYVWSESRWEDDDPDNHPPSTANAISGGLRFAPSLQLRFAF